MSLQLQCPACGCGFDLREARNDQEWREFCTLLTQYPQDVQGPLLQYLELFRPAKHSQLRSSVMLKLAGELLPLVKAQEIKRKHNAYIITHAVWAGAMLHLSNTRATLQLPLKGNGYLLETLANRAERLAAKAEASAIEAARNVGQGKTTAPKKLSDIASGIPVGDDINTQQPAQRLPAISEEQRLANLERIRKMLDDAFTEKQEAHS